MGPRTWPWCGQSGATIDPIDEDGETRSSGSGSGRSDMVVTAQRRRDPYKRSRTATTASIARKKIRIVVEILEKRRRVNQY
jgi:hypothetical protein